jgi:hypothetical protein
VGSTPGSFATEAELEAVLVATGPGDVRFEIVGSEAATPAMRVSFGGRTDDIPLTLEDVESFNAYVEEYGSIRLSDAQVREFQLRFQNAMDSTDSSTPCSPEQYEECYEEGVEECSSGGTAMAASIGSGAAKYIAPAGPAGILASALAGFLMARLTCNVPVAGGCRLGCNTQGPRCYPTGTCYDTCPENTRPTYTTCDIGGVRGQCCTWNGPNPGEDQCAPPSICYDDDCRGCPIGTAPGQGHCDGNWTFGCGACCIPIAYP